jgi:diadenosine tetraphosphate (Ap4A) HIT family hydrolase
MSPEQRLQELLDGNDPKQIARMQSGFAVMSDTQFLPGYCLLLAYPQVASLNELHGEARATFLADMGLLGDALREATQAMRINYSIYGNLDPFLHAHLIPRYADEDERYRTNPPFLYPPEIRDSEEHRYDAGRHEAIRLQIRSQLVENGYNLK